MSMLRLMPESRGKSIYSMCVDFCPSLCCEANAHVTLGEQIKQSSTVLQLHISDWERKTTLCLPLCDYSSKTVLTPCSIQQWEKCCRFYSFGLHCCCCFERKWDVSPEENVGILLSWKPSLHMYVSDFRCIISVFLNWRSIWAEVEGNVDGVITRWDANQAADHCWRPTNSNIGCVLASHYCFTAAF